MRSRVPPAVDLGRRFFLAEGKNNRWRNPAAGGTCLCLLLLLAAGALLLDPPAGESCGPFLPDAQFVYVRAPGPEFLHGQLGIVQPKYLRWNLVVAYRYLSDVPLSEDEVRALGPVQWPTVQYPPGLQMGGPLAAALWFQARNAVPGVQPLKQMDVYRHTMINGYYAAYQNCMDDAFDAARATLAARMKLWGEKSPNVTEWLRGQDAVFANCGGDRLVFTAPPPRIERAAYQAPPPLAPGADPLLAADRQYQTAAAEFYAAKFTDAGQAFRAVGANAASPWRGAAPYLIARTLIRQGTVDGDQDALGRAEAALQAILKDPNQQRWHGSARGLLEYVRGQLHPEDRMAELGAALAKRGSGEQIRRDLTDFTMLWDRKGDGPAARSELADWITSFQTGDKAHAVERWRASGAAPWLIAALSWSSPNDEAAPELIAAARKLQPASPAYPTAVFHGIRLQAGRKEREEARTWADEALAKGPAPDARNAFLAERLALARDWTEFLRFAPRRPVAANAAGADEPLSNYTAFIRPGPVFDWDAAETFNRETPLDLWVDASRNPLLPANLQADVAQAGWVRAIVLNRAAEARELAARAAALAPELAGGMREYGAQRDTAAARFAAVLFMLRNPGLSPVVREGFGRYREKPAQLDDLRDNWWRLVSSTEALASGNPSRGYLRQAVGGSVPAEFLSAAQRRQGSSEWASLIGSAAAAPDYFCSQTLGWARAHPDDARAPEALHLCVRSTRYGLRSGETGSWSRRAFQLLHSRYARSKWAAQTRYWY